MSDKNYSFRTIPDAHRKRTLPRIRAARPTANLPDEIDWRAKGRVLKVSNQGDCFSDWAFSAIGSVEAYHAAYNKRDVGCNGGLGDLGLEYIKANGGVDTEDSYPYVGKKESCKFTKENVGAILPRYGTVYYGEDYLKEAVGLWGPVVAVLDASLKSFQHYQAGVFYDAKCSSRELTHWVLVVGYGRDEKFGDYWLIKNSWGTEWGENGFMRLARNRGNHCGISSLASMPLYNKSHRLACPSFAQNFCNFALNNGDVEVFSFETNDCDPSAYFSISGQTLSVNFLGATQPLDGQTICREYTSPSSGAHWCFCRGDQQTCISGNDVVTPAAGGTTPPVTPPQSTTGIEPWTTAVWPASTNGNPNTEGQTTVGGWTTATPTGIFCPQGWSYGATFPNKCFFFTNLTQDRTTAAFTCQGLNPTAYLVSIGNGFENAEIVGLISTDTWLGIINLGGTWTWDDPNETGMNKSKAKLLGSYTNWANGQDPFNYATLSVADKQWHAVDGDATQANVVCQIFL